MPTEGEFGVITGDSKRKGVLRHWYAPDRWPRWLVYVFAIAAVAVTVLLRLTIGEVFSQRPLLILFVLPILMSAYLGGLGPGLVATFAAALGVIFLLIPPTHSFAIDKSADLIQWLMLIVCGVFISVLTEALHRFPGGVSRARGRRHRGYRRMNRHRLLIVEDEVIVALDMEDRLAALGYQLVGHALTGEGALELTRELRPDLVLMDIRLQGDMDGIAAAAEIRRRFHVPVIFLTAYSEDETLERAKLCRTLRLHLKAL